MNFVSVYSCFMIFCCLSYYYVRVFISLLFHVSLIKFCKNVPLKVSYCKSTYSIGA